MNKETEDVRNLVGLVLKATEMLTEELLDQLITKDLEIPKIRPIYGIGIQDTAIERLIQQLINMNFTIYQNRVYVEEELMNKFVWSIKSMKIALAKIQDQILMSTTVNEEQKLRSIMKNYNKFKWFTFIVSRFYQNYDNWYFSTQKFSYQKTLVTIAFQIYSESDHNEGLTSFDTLMRMINRYRALENLNENEMKLLTQIFEKFDLLGISGPYTIELKKNTTEILINWKTLPLNSLVPNDVVKQTDHESIERFSKGTQNQVIERTQNLQESIDELMLLYRREQSLAANVFKHSPKMMNEIFQYMNQHFMHPILAKKFVKNDANSISLIQLFEQYDNEKVYIQQTIELSMRFHQTRNLFFETMFDFCLHQGKKILDEILQLHVVKEDKKGEEDKRLIKSYLLGKQMSDVFMKLTKELLDKLFNPDFMRKFQNNDVMQIEIDTGYQKYGDFESQLKIRVQSAFAQFISDIPQNSQLLAIFANAKIEEKEGGDFDTFKHAIEYVFQSIDDQDKFMEYNLFYLVDRIYNNKEFEFKNQETDIKNIISSIDNDCAIKINQIQNNYNRYDPRNDTWGNFKSGYGYDQENSKEYITIKILPKHMPIETSVSETPLVSVLPEPIKKQIQDFKLFYNKLNFGQQLMTNLNYGLAEITFLVKNSDPKKRRKNLTTSIIQMIILITLSNEPGYQMTLQSLANKTKFQIKKVQDELRGLLKGLKQGTESQFIVKTSEEGNQATKDDTIIILNQEFNHSQSIFNTTNETGLRIIDEEPPERLDVCQCVMVRILKSTRTLPYNQLQARATAMITKFRLTPKLFRSAMASLMDEYLCRDEKDHSLIIYKPGNESGN